MAPAEIIRGPDGRPCTVVWSLSRSLREIVVDPEGERLRVVASVADIELAPAPRKKIPRSVPYALAMKTFDRRLP